jgi:hypothetical protein
MTDRNLANGSQWCRACGGPATVFGGLSTCANRASDGLQKSPRDHCFNLGLVDREFCEQCGAPASGASPCANCGERPLRG